MVTKVLLIKPAEKECFICGNTLDLEVHHVYYGSLRQASEKHGMLVTLCPLHHRGGKGVHFDKKLDLYLKQHYQRAFEEVYNHARFMQIFGRSYL